jgi:hypothetical protein
MDEDQFKRLANEDAGDDDVEAHKKPSQETEKKPSQETVEPADETEDDADFELHKKPSA